MPNVAYGLLAIALFMFAVATGQAIPNLDSALINFTGLGNGTQLLYQISILVIGFSISLIILSMAGEN